MKFGCVAADRWPDARDLLMPALLWAGEKSECDVVADLDSGMAQLWIGEDSAVRCAVVTCLSRTQCGLVCEIWLMGGRDHRQWLHFLDDIEDCARRRGCVSIEVNGRIGWARLLPKYRRKAVVLERKL